MVMDAATTAAVRKDAGFMLFSSGVFFPGFITSPVIFADSGVGQDN
jgi:hypothetical protein